MMIQQHKVCNILLQTQRCMSLVRKVRKHNRQMFLRVSVLLFFWRRSHQDTSCRTQCCELENWIYIPEDMLHILSDHRNINHQRMWRSLVLDCYQPKHSEYWCRQIPCYQRIVWQHSKNVDLSSSSVSIRSRQRNRSACQVISTGWACKHKPARKQRIAVTKKIWDVIAELNNWNGVQDGIL